MHLKLPTVIFGANGYGAHAKDERVSVRSLVEYTQMFTGYLRSQTAKRPGPGVALIDIG